MKKGFHSFRQGIRLIRENNLWIYALIPGLFSFIIAVAFFVISYNYCFSFFDGLSSRTDSYLRTIFVFLETYISIYKQILSLLFSLVIYIISYRLVANTIILPFIGLLLDKLEEKVLGINSKFDLKMEIKNLLYSLRLSVKYTLFSLLTSIAGFFTGPFQLAIFPLVQSYLLGKGSLDSVLERKMDNLKDREKKAKELRFSVIGLGFAQFLFILIPGFGIFFSSVFGAAGAFYLIHEALIKENASIDNRK
jgi:uncharacterized protein involved in cysteine biosynthesis